MIPPAGTIGVLGQRAAARFILLDVAPLMPIAAFQDDLSVEPLRVRLADALGILRLSHGAIEIARRVPSLARYRLDQTNVRWSVPSWRMIS
jgi:hypothetical protein